MKQYLISCSNCKQQTPHYAFRVSKIKGLKLMCSKCGCKKTQFHKLQFLHEYQTHTETKLRENKNESS